jgi:hypothetical protein
MLSAAASCGLSYDLLGLYDAKAYNTSDVTLKGWYNYSCGEACTTAHPMVCSPGVRAVQGARTSKSSQGDVRCQLVQSQCSSSDHASVCHLISDHNATLSCYFPSEPSMLCQCHAAYLHKQLTLWVQARASG